MVWADTASRATCSEERVPARDVAPGDLLAVAATGACGYSIASTYNRWAARPSWAVGTVKAGLWLRRETDDDLDRLEAAP